ncbi:hypothetical protein FRX31_022156, partial [Thalictrum thalictroides]
MGMRAHPRFSSVDKKKVSSVDQVDSFNSDAGLSQCLPGSSREYLYNDDKIPRYPEKRRPVKRELSTDSQEKMDKWFCTTGAKIGALPENQRKKLIKLLYTYKDLNSTDLSNLPCTDL